MDTVIKRDIYLNALIDKIGNGQIKVITGIRRCGKSFLLFELFREYLDSTDKGSNNIISIALDDMAFVEYRSPDKLYRYIEERIEDNRMNFVLIDEVQYAISIDELRHPEEVRLYGALNGLMRRKNIDIYVTGSNSKLLTKDVMTAFRGRGDEVRVRPLSFEEYYGYVGGDMNEAYSQYALYGGLPLTLFKRTDTEKTSYLQHLYDEVYFRDIAERYEIDRLDIMGELADDLCSSIGSLTNATKIARTLSTAKGIKVSASTIAHYLDCIEESFLFSKAQRYDIKGKRYFEYPVKYYCADTGLRNARLNFRQLEETHIMENIIYNTLVYRGYSVDVGVVEVSDTLSGKRTTKQTEIDFIASMGSKRFYIQSALNVDDPDKLATELRPLKNTADFFKRIIVSKNLSWSWTDEDGIVHMRLLDFLLNPECSRTDCF